MSFDVSFSKLRFGFGLVILILPFGHEARATKILWQKDIALSAR